MKIKKILLLSIIFITGCSEITSSSINSLSSTNTVSDSSSLEETSSLIESSSIDVSSSSEESSSEESSSEESLSEESSSSTVSSSSQTSSTSTVSTSISTSFASASYYDSIDFSLKGEALMKQLDDLLDSTSNTSFTYSSLFDIFKYSDADPQNPNNGTIISFYSGNPSTRSSMNREHTWPDSRGGGLLEKDPHMVRPTISSENSARGNSFFNENGTWDPASFDNPKYRGIAARVILYCGVKGQDQGLYLVDKTDDPRLSSTNSVTKKNWNPTMGKLSTLLKWNLEYDIDETEILRNDVLYTRFNHCRNPFIDNRSLGCQIWGETNEDTKKVCNLN